MENKSEPTIPSAETLHGLANKQYTAKNWKKWVLLYVIIATIIYAGVYIVFLSKKTTNPYSGDYNNAQTISQKTDYFSSIADAKIVYQKSDSIYLLTGINTSAQEIITGSKLDQGVTKLPIGTSIVGLSPDKNKLFYTAEQANKKDGLYTYDFQTKSNTKLTDADHFSRYDLLWSQNGGHFVVTQYRYYGNAQSNGLSTLYKYPSFKKLSSFYSYVKGNLSANAGSEFLIYAVTPIVFLNDESVIFLELLDRTSPIVRQTKNQIALLNIQTGSKKILVPSPNDDQQLLLVGTQNDSLYYAIQDQSAATITYHVLNLTDMTNKKIRESDVKAIFPTSSSESYSGRFPDLKANIPTEYANYHASSYLTPYYKDNNWLIFELNCCNNENPLVSIINQKDPKNTFKVITQGYNPVW